MKTFLIIFSAFYHLLSISFTGSLAAVVPATYSFTGVEIAAVDCTIDVGCSSHSECQTECGYTWLCNTINGTCLNFCDYYGYDGPECGQKECSSDGECSGTNPHCHWGKCFNCESNETWNGFECIISECASDSECPGSDAHCYLWKCFSCKSDETWKESACKHVYNFFPGFEKFEIALGVGIAIFVGIYVIIVGCILACVCICCPGCPGHSCRQQKIEDKQQTVFETTQIQKKD